MKIAPAKITPDRGVLPPPEPARLKGTTTLLAHQNEILMVPTPVLAEYLQGFADPRERTSRLGSIV